MRDGRLAKKAWVSVIACWRHGDQWLWISDLMYCSVVIPLKSSFSASLKAAMFQLLRSWLHSLLEVKLAVVTVRSLHCSRVMLGSRSMQLASAPPAAHASNTARSALAAARIPGAHSPGRGTWCAQPALQRWARAARGVVTGGGLPSPGARCGVHVNPRPCGCLRGRIALR